MEILHGFDKNTNPGKNFRIDLKFNFLKGTRRTRKVSNDGDWIIAWSIRIAMLLFVVVHALEWNTVKRPRKKQGTGSLQPVPLKTHSIASIV
ncbi:MAG: hypothetical protein ACKOOI_12650 [Pirellula sp.]